MVIQGRRRRKDVKGSARRKEEIRGRKPVREKGWVERMRKKGHQGKRRVLG